MTRFTRALSSEPWANLTGANLDTDIGQIGVIDEATRRSARLEVCSRAADADEARELLAMLGLDGDA